MFWSLLNKPPPALSSLSTWRVTGRKVLSDRPQGSGVHLGFAITGAMLSAGLFARAQRMVGSPGPCAGATYFSKIAAPLNTRLFIFKTFQAVQFFSRVIVFILAPSFGARAHKLRMFTALFRVGHPKRSTVVHFVLNLVAPKCPMAPHAPWPHGPTWSHMPLGPQKKRKVPPQVTFLSETWQKVRSDGPSGWRSSHLKEMLKARCKQSFLSALAAFCTRIANGSFSAECMAVITAARLVPIGKPSGGLRPIAVGDVLRRLAGKLLMDVIIAKTTEHLRPEQVGVQVPNAAETAARKVGLWAEMPNPTKCSCRWICATRLGQSIARRCS